MPKAMVSVGGQPLLWHVVTRLRAAGFTRIVVNVHHFAEQIIDYLVANDNFGLDIRISDESAQLLDTGGGIKHALPLLDTASPVLIHNVDILSNADLVALYHRAAATKVDALLLVSKRHTKRYLLFDEEYILDGWTNIETGQVRSPYPSLDIDSMKHLAFSGIHVLSPTVLPLFSSMPQRFGIIDFYLQFCHQCAFIGYEQPDLHLLDVGKFESLDEAEKFL